MELFVSCSSNLVIDYKKILGRIVHTELSQLLSLIIIANGTPIVLRVLLNNRFDTAVDFGHRLPDNRPVFGNSKTWRGIFASLITTSTAAWLLGHSLNTGLLVATYVVIGDLTSSFIKRRMGKPASSKAPLLDQIPESLFPSLMMMQTFKLDIYDVIQIVLIFIIIELLLSHVLYKWGIRKHPY
ncbi:MAG: CDP-archaeol synthase [Gammaproteobacteria bacterium]|nr:CDP-archaeol synthase [Gammaproteobacteria bacterium]